jgi:hypothetical protein
VERGPVVRPKGASSKGLLQGSTKSLQRDSEGGVAAAGDGGGGGGGGGMPRKIVLRAEAAAALKEGLDVLGTRVEEHAQMVERLRASRIKKNTPKKNTKKFIILKKKTAAFRR